MEKTVANILVVDDDRDILVTAKLLLKRAFTKVVTESDPVNLYKHLGNDHFDVVLLDMNFSPGVTSGREGMRWLREIKRKHPATQVVLNTAYGDINLAVDAMKEGATDFVVKPWDEEKMVNTLKAAVKLAKKPVQPQSPNKSEKPPADTANQYSKIVTQSPAMQPVLDWIAKVSATDADVLILGENGTGKELVARAIHRESLRAEGPFIKVDLGAIPESLFEAELFGHTKGAFTDAKQDRAGRFEMAQGGTLFLDEIGNLSLPMQMKLLSALQNRVITRVGSNTQIPIDVRLLSATNMALYQMVENGTFRQDLLYRINTVEIHLPPLRERPEDIAVLGAYFIEQLAGKYHKKITAISPAGLEKLQRYHWPGNIRELQHTIERAIIMTDQDQLLPEHLILSAPTAAQQPSHSTSPAGSSTQAPTTLNLEALEKEAITMAIQKHDGNLSKAAKELGMGRNTLYRKMDKYGIST